MDARIWTSSDGSKTFEGELRTYDPGTGAVGVTLPNGKKMTFKQDKLSEEDIAYLKKNGAKTSGPSARIKKSIPEVLPDPDGEAPSKATRSISKNRVVLENSVIGTKWKVKAEQVKSLKIENKHTGQKLKIDSGYLPTVVRDAGQTIDLASMKPVKPYRSQNNSVIADYEGSQSGLAITFSAT